MAEGLLEYIQRRAQAGRSAEEKVHLAIEALKDDPERRLVNPRHPEHEEAMSAWNEAHEILAAEPLLREKSAPDTSPYINSNVRDCLDAPAAERVDNAKQRIAETFDAKMWAGPNGKGKHPLFDRNSPRHDAAVLEYQELCKIAYGESEEK